MTTSATPSATKSSTKSRNEKDARYLYEIANRHHDYLIYRLADTIAEMGAIHIYEDDEELPDLAPTIYRQRLVVEGRCPKAITAEQIECYFRTLSVVCGMERLNDPVTHSSDKYGWAGWVHWEASGAHLYAWEDPLLFFSVDIYTCAVFDKVMVTEFTSAFFAAEEVVAKGF